MKRIAIFWVLLVVLAGLAGCNIPTPTPSSGITPTVQAITPIVTGSGTPGGVTPPPLPSFTPLTGSQTPGVTPPPPPSITPLPPTQTPGGPTATPPPTFAVPMTETPTPGGAINLNLLKNFTYEAVQPGTKIPLKDGAYDADNLHSKLVEPVAFGSLAGEGESDAALVLATNTGGTGIVNDLIAMIDQNGTPTQAGYIYVGDRIIVKNLQIEGGRMVLDYITTGPDDPSCCPTQHRQRSYVLYNGALRLISEQVLDSPTTPARWLPNGIMIDQPAMLETVTSPVHVQGQVWFVPPAKKLHYRAVTLHNDVLMEGDVPVEGEPGQPGSFAFDINLGSVSPGIFTIEIVDVQNGVLKGRSVVELMTK